MSQNKPKSWWIICRLPWLDRKQKLKKKIIKKGNKWFQYALTDPLNQQGIKKDPQRTVKIETVKNKYNFEVMNFQSEKKR